MTLAVLPPIKCQCETQVPRPLGTQACKRCARARQWVHALSPSEFYGNCLRLGSNLDVHLSNDKHETIY